MISFSSISESIESSDLPMDPPSPKQSSKQISEVEKPFYSLFEQETIDSWDLVTRQCHFHSNKVGPTFQHTYNDQKLFLCLHCSEIVNWGKRWSINIFEYFFLVAESAELIQKICDVQTRGNKSLSDLKEVCS